MSVILNTNKDFASGCSLLAVCHSGDGKVKHFKKLSAPSQKYSEASSNFDASTKRFATLRDTLAVALVLNNSYYRKILNEFIGEWRLASLKKFPLFTTEAREHMELHGGFFCNNNAYALKNIARLLDQIVKFSIPFWLLKVRGKTTLFPLPILLTPPRFLLS